MKKLLVVLFMLAACLTASAQVYVGADFGYGLYTLYNNEAHEWKPANMNATLNFGKAYERWRAELSVMITMPANDMSKSGAILEYSNFAAMFNLYFDIPMNESVNVYPTLGIGLASSHVFLNSASVGTFDNSSVTIACQAGVGARYRLNERHSFDFTVRYISLSEPSYASNYGMGIPVETSAIKLDLGYKFWFKF